MRGETRVADAEASTVAAREALDVARRESDERALRLRAALETRHEKRVDELRALHAAQVRTLRGENRRRAAAMQAAHDDSAETNVGLARHLEVASSRCRIGVGRGVGRSLRIGSTRSVALRAHQEAGRETK